LVIFLTNISHLISIIPRFWQDINYLKKVAWSIKYLKKRPATFVTGLKILLMFRLSLYGQRAGGHSGLSFNSYHVYTDGVGSGGEFILFACRDLVNHQLA